MQQLGCERNHSFAALRYRGTAAPHGLFLARVGVYGADYSIIRLAGAWCMQDFALSSAGHSRMEKHAARKKGAAGWTAYGIPAISVKLWALAQNALHNGTFKPISSAWPIRVN